MKASPEGGSPLPRNIKANASALSRQFSERGGKTIETEPLTAEEIAVVRRRYRQKEEKHEIPIPELSEEIAGKMHEMKGLAFKVLTPDERQELTAYLNAVWQKHQRLSKIIVGLITLLDPRETPPTLTDEEYGDVISLIDDPEAMAKRFDEEGYEK